MIFNTCMAMVAASEKKKVVRIVPVYQGRGDISDYLVITPGRIYGRILISRFPKGVKERRGGAKGSGR